MTPENLMWTEKYRPSTFEEIIGQDEIISKVKSFVEKGEMPHLLFAGPPGTGKTTTAIVIAKELYGEEYKEHFLELNASDERGIEVIRSKLKDFARSKKNPNVPFKIVYLDESDALTTAAQQALRRTMEKYSSETRFILSCNYLTKIIDPIQSRCAVFKFKKLQRDEIIKIVEKIAKNEKLKLTEDAKEAIYEISQGDCRKAENILQSCGVLKKEIDKELIYSMASLILPSELKEILNSIINKNYYKSISFLEQLIDKYALSGIDFITQFQAFVSKENISDELKIKIIEECANTESNLVNGCSDEIQLRGFLAKLCKK